MGTVSRVHTFASGAILTAAQLNNEFDNLLTSSAINGGLDATNLGVTAGQATASKALVVDASRNLADATGSNRINNLALSGTFESTGAITASAGITSGGNIVSDTDSTDDLGTTGVRWANLFVDDVTVTNNVTIGGTLTLTGGITLNGNTTIGDSSADTLTVNSTITSNLIFTDATYDIGASGATRPRDLFLSRNAVMGGTLGVTGLITATGGVSGALTGDVTGNVTGGTISGTTGTFSGDVTVDSSVLKVDTANNRVGINIASPVAALNVYGNNYSPASGGQAVDGLVFRGGTAGDGTYTNGLSFSYGGGSAAIAGVQNGADSDTMGMAFFTHSSGTGSAAAEETMRLHSNGDLAVDTDTLFVDASADRVGINTASPTAPLEVYASATTAQNAAIVIDGPAANNYEGVQYRVGGVDVGYTAQESTGRMYHGAEIEHRFRTGSGSTVGGTDALTIDSSQRVGIGTTSPSYKIHSVGAAGTASALALEESTSGVARKARLQQNSGATILAADGTSNSLIIQTDGSERLRVLATGGLTFNGDTAAANALDDYEEGTYSVTDQSGAGLSFTVNSNRYVKIGKLVWIGIEIIFPTTSDTNIVYISLPFAQSTAQRASLSCVTNRSDVTVQGYASTGTARVGIIESAASPVSVTNASLSGKYVIIGGVYEAA